MPSRELSFSSTRVPPRRKALRAAGVVAGVVLAVLLVWAGIVGLLWGYAWMRLGPEDVAALSEDRTVLGPADAAAPPDATTVLVTRTGPVDPTVPREPTLEGPVALVQVGGPREDPAVLTLPMELPVTIDGLGELPLDEVQLEGGLDLMVRAVADYSAVRIDHVVTHSEDALPRLVEVLAPLEVCGSAGCRTMDGAQLRAELAQADDAELVRVTSDVLRAVAQQVDTRFVITSPIRTKRLIDVVAEEFASDVSLRGVQLLPLAEAFAAPVRLDRDTLPLVVNPDTGQVVPLSEPAMVRFGHLREGTALAAAGEDPQEDLEQDLIDSVTIAVLNGAGIDGLAGEVRLRLESAGYRVAGTGNAPAFDRERTVINYVSDDETTDFVAALLAEELGGAALEPLDTSLEFEGRSIDLLVTIGEDQAR